jgi:hypothetical protein
MDVWALTLRGLDLLGSRPLTADAYARLAVGTLKQPSQSYDGVVGGRARRPVWAPLQAFLRWLADERYPLEVPSELSGGWSTSLRALVHAALTKEASRRPAAAALLEHAYFSEAASMGPSGPEQQQQTPPAQQYPQQRPDEPVALQWRPLDDGPVNGPVNGPVATGGWTAAQDLKPLEVLERRDVHSPTASRRHAARGNQSGARQPQPQHQHQHQHQHRPPTAAAAAAGLAAGGVAGVGYVVVPGAAAPPPTKPRPCATSLPTATVASASDPAATVDAAVAAALATALATAALAPSITSTVPSR